MTLPLLSLKTKLILALAGISLVSLVYLIVKSRPTPTPPSATFKDVWVGKDSKEEIIQKLGPPLSSSISASGTEQLNYQSQNKYWPHQIYIQPESQKSTLIKERLLKTVPHELNNYLDKYGQPEAVLVSNDHLPALGFRLHVFAKSGLAVNANPDTGVVFEIWYFPPTTLEKFQTDYASEITIWTEPQSF